MKERRMRKHDDTVSLFSIDQPIKLQTENLLCKVDPVLSGTLPVTSH